MSTNHHRELVVLRVDQTIGKVLDVLDKYASHPNGPSVGWVQGLADVVVTLARAREFLVEVGNEP